VAGDRKKETKDIVRQATVDSIDAEGYLVVEVVYMDGMAAWFRMTPEAARQFILGVGKLLGV